MIAARFEIRGNNLYDGKLHVIATTSGGTIFDSGNRRVASVRGDELFDAGGRKLVTFNGSDIYDSQNNKVGTLSDVLNSIKGAGEGILHVALWYCFVR